ncbi:hypothetical protein CEXT_121771 [Caerostris extrusa]|uniref:SLH domain-containing protein n=1 Tax=Caerostris extrusa TaxID=172846 RepID=A0AAV4N7C5_CAEEX|nr:hypothetical protein CEXT_121771 [Caerostris extrusa]
MLKNHQVKTKDMIDMNTAKEVIEAYNLVFSYKNDDNSLTCQDKTNTFSPKLTDPTVQATLMMLKNMLQT